MILRVISVSIINNSSNKAHCVAIIVTLISVALLAGSTALMWAAAKGSAPLVKQLLQAGAHVNLTRPEFPVKGKHKHNHRLPEEGSVQTHTQQAQEQTGDNNNAALSTVGDADKIRGREVSALDLALANLHSSVANILRSYMVSK